MALLGVAMVLGPALAARASTPGQVDEEHVHVRRGDTFGGLLAARGVGKTEAQRWIKAAATVYDLRRLRPRQGLTLRFEGTPRSLRAIRYEIDDRALLILTKTLGGIRAERGRLPYFTEVKGAAGVIKRGLREDAREAGVPASVVSELGDVFEWELDLENGLRRGDQFRVLYENIWQAGDKRPQPGKVLGAEIISRGKPITAVFFEDADGHGGYYRPSGDPLTRDFLRYPLQFNDITSKFSLLRRHPVLRQNRPHLGVDFAAPVGTPVRAVGSGTVSEAGWVSQLGRAVSIDHGGALASSYGHLSRIAYGISAGKVVERGQVIGYVGASGLATGPHLHFAMHRDGAYLDPLALSAAAGARIPRRARLAFARVQAAVTRQLAALPPGANPATVSLSAARTLE
jgi:murein DD-endopeptidase MepM/ murein hydrolase activator NlpD